MAAGPGAAIRGLAVLKGAALLAAATAGAVLAAGPLTAAVTLVEDGAPRAVLVLPAEPAAAEREAAAELADWIERISGARLPLAAAGEPLPGGRLPVFIGAAAPDQLLEAIRAKGADPESFILRVVPGGVYIRGLERPEGTRHGAYELLEQLGVRWFAPGDFYTVVPAEKTLTLPLQETIQVPSFAMRDMRGGYAWGDFKKHNRMPGIGRPVGRHGMPPLGRFDERHPERYGIVSGERDTRGTYCLSNPGTLEAVVAHIVGRFRENPALESWVYSTGTHDHPRVCACAGCLALDGGDRDPFSGIYSQVDRWVWFYNRVLERFDEELPGKKLEIAFYAYGSKMRPPVRHVPDARLRPAMAPIHLCRRHSPVNPVCPDKTYVGRLVEEWSRHGLEIYDRGFWFNLACIGAPFPMWDRLAEEIPWAHRAGIRGWSTQATHNWGADLPSIYIAAKLLWDHRADVEALMDDFCRTFFGPAAGPMRRYYRLIGEANNNSDHHTGSSWDVPFVYPPELRARGRALLEEAAGMIRRVPRPSSSGLDDAGDRQALYLARVEMVRRVLEYTDAFCRMMETRRVHDWAGSHRAYLEMEERRRELETYEPSAIVAGIRGQGAERFTRLFGTPTVDAFARVSGGNRFVAGLADEWQFLLDRHQVGEDLGWQRPETTGGNWQRILTGSSWSNQGLHHYKGEAWYRQRVDIPAAFAGRRVFLWFGGVHNQAKVWVNGQLVGLSHTSALRPFEFDVTGAVRPGENVVAVRLSSTRVREVGVGGIVAPAFFYAPAAGDAAAVAYPLEDRFPVPLHQIRVAEGDIP